MLRPKFAAVGAALLSLVLIPSAAGAAQPQSSIDNVSVACNDGSFAVPVTFSHSGAPVDVVPPETVGPYSCAP
jgi:hypothetical protein